MRNGNFMWPCAKNEVSPAVPALCGAELNVNPGEIIGTLDNVVHIFSRFMIIELSYKVFH